MGSGQLSVRRKDVVLASGGREPPDEFATQRTISLALSCPQSPAPVPIPYSPPLLCHAAAEAKKSGRGGFIELVVDELDDGIVFLPNLRRAVTAGRAGFDADPR